MQWKRPTIFVDASANNMCRVYNCVVCWFVFTGWRIVSLHSSDNSAEAGWSGRSELLASSPQVLPSGREENKLQTSLLLPL